MGKNVYTLEYQNKLLLKIRDGLIKKTRVLLYALCGSGKTIMTLMIIKDWILEGKRVAVSCYDMVDIRSQWMDKIKEFYPELLEYLQVVCSSSDVESYKLKGINAVCNRDISKEKLLTIFIPQTIPANDFMGKFDLFVIDEAHENLEVKSEDEGKLKKIIRFVSKPKTRYLGLSGTGYNLIKKGKFFEKAEIVIYDLIEGYNDGAINDGALIGEYFNFTLTSDCYNANKELNKSGIGKFDLAFNGLKGLNKNGRKILKDKSVSITKLEGIINDVEGKTLVIVPGGSDCAEAVRNFICIIKSNRLAAVENTSKIGDGTGNNRQICQNNEEMFRNPNSNTNFMVVIAKCGTGWDFPELNNVIDLTFTRNPMVIIQRFARTIRIARGSKKPLSKYIYCSDQSRSKNKIIFDMGQALVLMTKRGILSGGVNVSIPAELLNRICIMDDTNEIKISIDPITLDEFLHYEKETVIRKTLSEITKEENESGWAKFWIPIVSKIKKVSNKKCVEFFIILNSEELTTIGKLEKVRKDFGWIYKEFFDTKKPEIVLEEAGLC